MSAAGKEGEGMRIWFKIFKDTHLLKEETIEDESTDTRTHKVFNALEEVRLRFDLAKPIWLPKILRNLKKWKTRFAKDSFVEDIDFDYMEIHVIEED